MDNKDSNQTATVPNQNNDPRIGVRVRFNETIADVPHRKRRETRVDSSDLEVSDAGDDSDSGEDYDEDHPAWEILADLASTQRKLCEALLTVLRD